MKSEAGFTLVEVLIALSILSSLGFVLLKGFTDSGSAIGRTYSLGKQNILVLQIDDTLREEITAVRPPYWLTEAPFEYTENGISFPYYKGYAESNLLIYLEKDYLVMEREEARRMFKGVTAIDFDIFDINEGSAQGDGVTVTITYATSEPSTHTVSFGGGCMRNE